MLNKELQRLLAVEEYIKTPLGAESLNAIALLASEICDTPVAIISIIDDQQEFILAKEGIEITEGLLPLSFSAETVLHNQVLTISDTRNHKKFTNTDLAITDAAIRFYSGATLISAEGYKVGRLYVLDEKPKQLTKSQENCLELLAKQVILYLDETAKAHALSHSIEESLKKDTTTEAETLLHAFFNTGDDYKILLNTNLDVVAHNYCAADFIKQVTALELHDSSNMLDYISPLFISEFKSLCSKALLGEKIEYEHFVNMQSSANTFSFTLNPTYDCNNKIIGLAVLGTNINRQKKQEKTIKHQSDTLSVIAQLQSHQVRQPVSSILGLMSLIKEDNYNPQREYLLGLEKATHQLDEVIQTIVMQSRNVE